jgi:lysyl-tRNA synthetase class II
VKDSLVFLCTPDPKIGQDQIDAVREEEPEFTDEECIAEVRRIRIEDASAMKVNYAQILEDTLSALLHAPSDRELDAIWADLPEAYRDRLLDKAMDKIDTELLRTRKYAIQGVKGVSAKRKILKADTLILEPLQFGTA